MQTVMNVLLTTATFAMSAADAQEAPLGGRVGEMTMTSEDLDLFERETYSPYAGRTFPTRPLWGDTHLHTSNSLDARAFGALLDPEQAYRFSRGEEVTTSHGLQVKLSRPLDWLVVAATPTRWAP